jgi:hypothetical protein
MLKRFVIAAAFVSLAAAAHAQSMDDEDMGDDGPMQGMSMSHRARDWSDDEDRGGARGTRDRGEDHGGWDPGSDRGGYERGAERGGWDRGGGQAGPGGPGLRRMMMMHRMFERMGSGAAFRIRSGDQVVAVRCPREESMKACVDATTTLIERLRGMRTGSIGSGGQGGGSGAGQASPGAGPQPVPRDNLVPDGTQGAAPKP